MCHSTSTYLIRDEISGLIRRCTSSRDIGNLLVESRSISDMSKRNSSFPRGLSIDKPELVRRLDGHPKARRWDDIYHSYSTLDAVGVDRQLGRGDRWMQPNWQEHEIQVLVQLLPQTWLEDRIPTKQRGVEHSWYSNDLEQTNTFSNDINSAASEFKYGTK